MVRVASTVRLRRVSKRHRRGPWVLRDVDLELPRGTTTVVIGANGSGKTTLLRVTLGLTQPTTGTREATGSRMAYAPERLAETMPMTVRAYLAHMARLQGVPAPEAQGRIQDLLSGLAVEPGPDAPVRSLSKGNSQKVALAQAFLGASDLLVLDEAFSGLDPEARRQAAQLIAQRRSEGAAVLLSAHARLDAIDVDRSFTLLDNHLVDGDQNDSRAITGPPGHPGGVQIVLRGTGDGDDGRDLAALNGVIALERHYAIVVRAETEAVELVLRQARATGRSVTAVERQPDLNRLSPEVPET